MRRWSFETVTTAESNEGLYRKHEYRLRDGWQGVMVTTTIRNDSSGFPTTSAALRSTRRMFASIIAWRARGSPVRAR